MRPLRFGLLTVAVVLWSAEFRPAAAASPCLSIGNAPPSVLVGTPVNLVAQCCTAAPALANHGAWWLGGLLLVLGALASRRRAGRPTAFAAGLLLLGFISLEARPAQGQSCGAPFQWQAQSTGQTFTGTGWTYSFTPTVAGSFTVTLSGPSESATPVTIQVTAPVAGPSPTYAAALGGAAFTLVKNWDFGTNGTIRNTSDLVAEFQFHDQFNTIANGTKYGGIIIAPTTASAIGNLSTSLNLPNNMQPVEDPARPIRSFTADTIECRVQPLSATQTTCSTSLHNVGTGSFVSKWTLPKGGILLRQDIVWETRIRLVNPCAGFWFAMWTAGNLWNQGAEMDTPESFGAPNVFPPAHLFHVNSRGGVDAINYSNWQAGMADAGVPGGTTDLTQWHVWTWFYGKDDSYKTFFDNYEVQHGTLHWTEGATDSGTPINMSFLFDFTWGNTNVASVDLENVAASTVQMTYEMDYSRVYLR